MSDADTKPTPGSWQQWVVGIVASVSGVLFIGGIVLHGDVRTVLADIGYIKDTLSQDRSDQRQRDASQDHRIDRLDTSVRELQLERARTPTS